MFELAVIFIAVVLPFTLGFILYPFVLGREKHATLKEAVRRHSR